MKNAGLDEAQAGIKISGGNINNLRYTDDTTLRAESKEELKSLLMKVKVEIEKVGLKLNIQGRVAAPWLGSRLAAAWAPSARGRPLRAFRKELGESGKAPRGCRDPGPGPAGSGLLASWGGYADASA